MRRTHIIKKHSLKTLCGQSKTVLTDCFDGIVKWVKGWDKENTERYLKTNKYCGHCIKKLIKFCYKLND